MRESVFEQIGRLGGPVTGKRKQRAMLSAYVALVDREARLAQAIGLGRFSASGEWMICELHAGHFHGIPQLTGNIDPSMACVDASIRVALMMSIGNFARFLHRESVANV